MKKFIKRFANSLPIGMVCYLLFAMGNPVYGQDSTGTIARVKNTFGGSLIIDNQTVMVPAKKTFEFTIQHRFGTIINGYSDFYGLFAPANIRLGWNYTPINNLQLGIGICKEKMQWDGNVKYAITKQAVSHGCPISVTYFGDVSVSTMSKKENFVSDADRISYFNQLIFARKITSKISVQVSPSLSYFNNVEGYLDSLGEIMPKMKNSHLAIAFMGKYQFTDGFGVIANYDQPLTEHPMNNPHPNMSLGIEFGTTGHSFQLFIGNYQSIIPQENNVHNQNDYLQSRYLIGFNVTRKWYH